MNKNIRYNHPFRIVISFWVLAFLGIFGLDKLSVDLEPKIGTNQLLISYSYPDATPLQVENDITAPVENALSTLKDVNSIQSVSSYHSGYIQLEMNPEADIDQRKFEASILLKQLQDKLPDNIGYPIVTQSTPDSFTESPLLVYQVMAPNNTSYIGEVIRKSFQSILTLKGIKKVELSGVDDQSMIIEFDQLAMERNRLSIQDIKSAITRFQRNQDEGINVQEGNLLLKVNVFDSTADITSWNQLSIKTHRLTTIKLADIAMVKVLPEKPDNIMRVNGKNSITLSVWADKNVNRLQLAKTTKEKIQLIDNSLPEAFEMLLSHDDSRYIDRELHKIYTRAGLSVLILFLLILLSGRGLKYLTILYSGIIINLFLTLFFCWIFEISIHLYTLAGLTISLGLIIDNAIIVVDHIKKQAKGAVLSAIIAASLTTIAALCIVFFLPENERQSLQEFSVIISISLGTSIIISLFYTPAITELLKFQTTKQNTPTAVYIGITKRKFKQNLFHNYRTVIQFLSNYKKSVLLIAILAFGIPVFLLPHKIENNKWYNSTFGSDIYNNSLRPWVDKTLGGALRLFVQDVFERYSYRTPEETKLYVTAQLPPGTKLEEMDKTLRFMEKYLQTISGLKNFVTRLQSGEYGRIEISFSEENQKGVLPYWLKNRLIAHSLEWGGADWSVYGVGQGFSNAVYDQVPSFKVTFMGYEYYQLEKLTKIFGEQLEKNPRVQNIDNNARLKWNEKSRTIYTLDLDASSLSLMGTSAGSVQAYLENSSISDKPITYTLVNNQMVPVYLKDKDEPELSIQRLMQKPFKVSDNKYMILSDITQLEEINSINSIHRKNRRYIRQVAFDYYGSHRFGEKHLKETLAKFKPSLPPGYETEYKEWKWNWEKEKRQYGLLVILMVAVYIICAVLFENLIQPLLIVFCVPLSFIGLFLTFSWFDLSFDQGGYAAFVLLGGLVVNSAIFLINEYNALKNIYGNGEAIFEAIKVKSFPILLTIISTCAGLIPFLIGGDSEVFWFALAAGTIGGLLFSILVVFLVVPALIYKKN